MAEAWGCYPTWTTIEQLDYGMCPEFLNRFNPESSFSPVCTLVPGSVCGGEQRAWSRMLRNATAVAQSMIMVSLVLYAWSIPTKVDYYSVAYARCMISSTRRKGTIT